MAARNCHVELAQLYEALTRLRETPSDPAVTAWCDDLLAREAYRAGVVQAEVEASAEYREYLDNWPLSEALNGRR